MNIIPMIGRVLFSLLFIVNGWNHFTQYEGLVGYASMMGAPLPSVSVIVTGLMLVIGGLSLLTGYYHQIGSWLLATFLILAAFIMHAFWGVDDPAMASTAQTQFFKDLSLAGGAILASRLSSEQIKFKKDEATDASDIPA